MIPTLIAKDMGGSFCDTFDPTRPGDSLSELYSKVFPSKENPLVLVFEEFDIMIEKIHHDKGVSTQ